MRAIRVHEHGGPETLELDDDVERPTPQADEILVAVSAAGINPVDTYFREGSYPPTERPFIPGVDVAGTVESVGAGVERFAPGDRVFGTGIGNADYHGSYAEYARIPTDRVVTLPDGVDPIQAGAAGVVAGTAWRALIDHGDITPEDVCLVHGGSGGVGHVAVQLADIAGARVIATAADEYADDVHALGAGEVLSYRDSDLAESIQERAPNGVDVILDHKLQQYASLDAAVAGTGGRVVGIGEDDPQITIEDITAARSRDVQFTFMSMFNTPDLRVPLRRIAGLLEQGSLQIEVDRRYELDEASAAHRQLFEDSFLGKRVFVP